MENEFITPQGHKNFHAKKLFNEAGQIKWGAIAYIEKDGGGPIGNHTHDDNHIFVIVEGEVEIFLENESHIVKKDETFFVDGRIPHSIWNHGSGVAKVIKLSVAQ